ncbi:MAG TPA: hypothetical protein VHP54_07415 [Caproiciproducens sp.]|nr:hypothetical protein [Caproiciproducens sp.]
MTYCYNLQPDRKNESADQSQNMRRRTEKMLDSFKNLKIRKLQAGKSEDNPELVFIAKAIHNFEEDLETLQSNSAPK